MKRPPVERFYYTASLGQMAVARRDGGIYWREPWGDQEGILLWDDLEQASAWQITRAGRPAVVVEFDRSHVRTGLLVPVESPEVCVVPPGRAWVYPEEIWFEQVRWHTFREDLAQPAGHYTINLPEPVESQQDLPRGTITLNI